MALVPAANDIAALAELKAGRYNSGGTAVNNDTPAARIGRRIVAHFGLSPFAGGQINLVAEKLLAAAKNDESKIVIESARADLIERGLLS
ncbi:MAG TPA: hypothetical protein VJ437_11135 [Acidiferrobacterales bacterium]|nr:hypothetical protein [Acidiferrobacterales bacterium]